MQFNGAFQWIYDIGNWLFKFMYLHLLWLGFTVLGLGLFGIWPATSAVFSVMQKWIEKDGDTNIFQNFKKIYKKEFKKSTILGLVIIAMGAFFYVDFVISKQIIQST